MLFGTPHASAPGREKRGAMRIQGAMVVVLGVTVVAAQASHACQMRGCSGYSSAIDHARSDRSCRDATAHRYRHYCRFKYEPCRAACSRASFARRAYRRSACSSPGSELHGHVTAVRRPGKVKGRSYIAVRFTALVPRESSDRYSVDTGRISRHRPGDQEEGRCQGWRARGGRCGNRCAHRR